jgi:peptidoglycan/LPS O-acetylase OafA/YrhL
MVAIFFMLSAFLLYRPMIAYRTGGPPRPSVRHFARRRLLRIYPAYWVALTVLAIYPGISGPFTGHWWSFYSLAQYLMPVASGKACSGPAYNCGLLQSWTLTVEMTFYIMLPFFAAGTAWIARRFAGEHRWMRIELGLIAALGALSLLLAILPLGLRDDPWFIFSFAAHFDWLGVGLAMAVLSVVYGRREESLPGWLRFLASRPGLCWAGALAMYGVSVAAFRPVPLTVAPFTSVEYLAIHFVQFAVGALLVLPVAFGNPNLGLPRRLLAGPWLIGLGLVSYGFYLWQVTIGIELGYGGGDNGFLVVLLGTTLITLPLAVASYFLIERPLMLWKPGRRRRRAAG